jgi:hypothetical protein
MAQQTTRVIVVSLNFNLIAAKFFWCAFAEQISFFLI